VKFCRCCILILTGIAVLAPLSGCRRKLGWGAVLWAQQLPGEENAEGIPSGIVVPVYARSNIEKKWIAGIPRKYRPPEFTQTMIEIPLAQLHLTRTRIGAKHWIKANLGEYALMYAETLQNGLPIRTLPENGSQRAYRLRAGEIIKIISPVEGIPAVGASGDPLPGQWFNVLTENGTRGYCFSYRLRLFDYAGGSLGGGAAGTSGHGDDYALDTIIAKKWSASEYWDMINANKLIIEDLEKDWGFSFGEDSGIANIYVSSLDKSFHYSGIRRDNSLQWRFDGTSLRFQQISENQIKVEFDEQNDVFSATAPNRSFIFYALPVKLNTLIDGEKARREALYKTFYTIGPVFSSETYGSIYLNENHDFIWENYDALSGIVIPLAAIGRGKVDFAYFLGEELTGLYDGIVTFKFASVNGPAREVNFLYKFNTNELKLANVWGEMIQNKTVERYEPPAEEEPLVFRTGL
jgi:hypothetical protein